MVLYKRKPIELPRPKPLPSDLNVQIWHIDETGEWFPTYEEYLERLDFYTRHQFTCEITGASCLTFFEALDSEESRFKYVEEKFPLKLREPVARFLHFHEIRRLDVLVEKVYARFKNDYFPGELVYLRKPNSTASNANSTVPSETSTPAPPPPEDPKKSGESSATYFYPIRKYDQLTPPAHPYIIKEKVQFNANSDTNPDGKTGPQTKYMLIDEKDPHDSVIADETQIYRDRSTFTKHLIKCFFKITFQKASYKMGAPWCVKPEYLAMYGLTMDWPPEMLKYKAEPGHVQTDDDGEESDRDRKRSHSGRHDSSDEGEGRKESKKKKKNTLKKEEPTEQKETTENISTASEIEQSAQVQETPLLASAATTITSIVDDMVLPFQPLAQQVFDKLHQYNINLESLDVKETENDTAFPAFDKILQINQFLNTFGNKLYISNFTLEQFITSLKCSDPYELKGEVVYVNLKKDQSEIDDDDLSDWKRNSKMRKMINSKNDEYVEYRIIKDDPADDEMIDNINSNGSSLFVECFVALLRLIINENGDWTCLVVEEWVEDKDIMELPIKNEENSNNVEEIKEEDAKSEDVDMIKQENSNEGATVKSEVSDVPNGTSNDNEKNYAVENGNSEISTNDQESLQEAEEEKDQEREEEDDSESIEDILYKCLNYRNVNWAERLSKRQFNNNNWLLILLGVFEDCKHIPMYTDIIQNMFQKILPKGVAQTQIPKQLWRNFCRNLTLKEKVDALWILVDLVSNYCSEVRSFVDDAMELCGIIRSERFRVSKEIKNVSNSLYQSTIQLRELETIAQMGGQATTFTNIENLQIQPANGDTNEIKPAENGEENSSSQLPVTERIEKLKQELEELEQKLATLQNDKTILDKQLMLNDGQRLRSLGMDRYGNKYFWFELFGQVLDTVPKSDDHNDWEGLSYQNGRVWLQGPHKDAAKFFLDLSEEQITNWRRIAKQDGRVAATKEVFGVYTEGNKTLYNQPDGTLIVLVDEEGNVNQDITLTPILRKIIDETPAALLLSEEQWYAVETYEDFDFMLNSFNQWGRKEHDLIKQVRPVQEYIQDVYMIRNHNLKLSDLNKTEQSLINELKEYEFNDTEHELMKGSDNPNNTEGQLEKIEKSLDTIVQRVMELDDQGETDENKAELKTLEEERDRLLAEQDKLASNGDNGGRLMARSEKKKMLVRIQTKVEKQMEILTDLINNRHFKAMEDVIAWKNDISLKVWGSELRRNASGAKKNTITETVAERFDEIVDLTSRIASQ